MFLKVIGDKELNDALCAVGDVTAGALLAPTQLRIHNRREAIGQRAITNACG